MLHTNNRQRLCDKLNGELLVFTAYDSMQLSGDTEAPFLQESTFWWLTGIEEAGWKLILDTLKNQSVLVCPEHTEQDLIFNGAISNQQISDISGINKIIKQSDFEAELRLMHRSHTVVGTLDSVEHHNFVLNPAKNNLVNLLKRVFDNVRYIDLQINELKAIKQPEEQKRLTDAVKLTVDAFKNVRKNLVNFKNESEVMAEFTYAFQKNKATHAYAPIVASGINSCTLHYVKNDTKLNSRNVLLIDIGARFNGYSADVTRTYCLNPTKRQIEVHKSVLNAHLKIITLLQPGLAVSDYLKQVDVIMKDCLKELKLLKDVYDEDTYRRYFPHSIGHGLGIDTHDSLGEPRYFVPGMIITVEPGVYIREEKIGVRLEDDILITEKGHINLTKDLPLAL